MGPAAVVLSTRNVNRLPWLPWLGGREVEVTAAVDSELSADRLSVPETDTRPTDASTSELAARLRAGGVEHELAMRLRRPFRPDDGEAWDTPVLSKPSRSALSHS